uniref:Cnidarian restricted protein n=1 Tax=Clytia hemisphaerica TaxID=252671 RepID=A0A7M5V4Y1_9CNID|eukprot:TCONS_00000109-protein
MKIWKALLLVSFLVYKVHCETEQEAKTISNDEETTNDIENDEVTMDLLDQDEDQEDEQSEDEASEQLENEEEMKDELEEQDLKEDEDASYKRFLYTKKVFIFKDKHPVQCQVTKSSNNPIRCYLKYACVKRHGNKCIKKKVWKFCVFRFTKTCLFTSKFVIKKCFRIRHGGGYKVKCYKSAPQLVKIRKSAGVINKAKLVKVYYTKH